MTSKNDGGQAFPYNTAWGTPGMSLRDWFAGQVIAGHFHIDPAVQSSYAQTAYTMADAMLAARDK
ncbi:hypothetical protein LB579_29360 [Mesorhizobium sp. BR1-1-7]|uniref:hypothetical protein n=1 Tax=Mesorhizobium sp. BR1-1-7 TaxID=2876647 RepID=UPI001CCDE0CD|nr:hypothetical protein [Mesorhizobium sp. BR1-1-7]MBZ9921803.1 hypothetical protein [Mesorhizobium sp. BR1-1-7]